MTRQSIAENVIVQYIVAIIRFAAAVIIARSCVFDHNSVPSEQLSSNKLMTFGRGTLLTRSLVYSHLCNLSDKNWNILSLFEVKSQSYAIMTSSFCLIETVATNSHLLCFAKTAWAKCKQYQYRNWHV